MSSSSVSPGVDHTTNRRPWAWLLVGLLPGAFVRFWNIGAQVLVGDEIHGVAAAVAFPAAVLVHYRESDHGIVLALWNRLLIVLGVPLTETLVRVPVLVAGLAALVALPLLFAAIEGERRVAFAASLAIAPLLVWYSRIARPHMLAMLFACVAAACFWLWWRREGRAPGLAAAIVLLASLAGWSHLLAGPFLASMFTFGMLDWLVRARHRPDLFWRLIGLGAGVAAGWAAFILPVLPSLRALVGWNAGSGHATLANLGKTAQMLAGSRFGWASFVFFAAAAAGWTAAFRADRRWALFTLTLVVGHAVGVLLLGPFAIDDPVVLSRYLLPMVPFLLSWVARCPPPAVLARHQLGKVWMPALLATLVAVGPLTDRTLWRSSFVHGQRYVAFAGERPQLTAAEIPAFYRQLASAGGVDCVIEVPWVWLSRFGEIIAAYQELHRKRVLVAGGFVLWGDTIRPRNQLPLDTDLLLASGARYAVLHSRPRVALRRGFAANARRDPYSEFVVQSAEAAEVYLRDAWGQPHHREPGLRVWDLDRVRRRVAQDERGRRRQAGAPGRASAH